MNKLNEDSFKLYFERACAVTVVSGVQWDLPLTRWAVVLNDDVCCRALLDDIQPVNVRGEAQVFVPYDLHSSLQNLCTVGTRTHNETTAAVVTASPDTPVTHHTFPSVVHFAAHETGVARAWDVLSRLLLVGGAKVRGRKQLQL